MGINYKYIPMTKTQAIKLAKLAITQYNRKGMITDAKFWKSILNVLIPKKTK